MRNLVGRIRPRRLALLSVEQLFHHKVAFFLSPRLQSLGTALNRLIPENRV